MIDYVTIEITRRLNRDGRAGVGKGLTRRVFRRMLDGSLEWAAYDDWRTHNERARFFGRPLRDLPLLDDLLKGARHA